MPLRRRVSGGILICAGVAAIAVRTVAPSPLGPIAAAQFGELRGAAETMVAASLPQFGRPADQPAESGPIATESARLESPAHPLPDTPHAGGRTTRPMAVKILKAAAQRHQVDPRLVLALSYWESGWDQSKVSDTGAVGLMQVEPPTAQEAGPALLGRSVNIDEAVDNADVGTAVLRHNLDTFHDAGLALAAYYQGPTSVRNDGLLPETEAYVQGILALAARMTA